MSAYDSMTIAQVKALDLAEQVDALAEIWGEIAAANPPLPLSREDRQLLDDRLEKHRNDPRTKSWAEVRASIEGRLQD